MMDVDSVLSLLRDLGVRFEPRVSVSEGEFVAVLPELQIVAGGPSFEEAMADLVDAVEAYADDFFSRLDFYRETDRWEHAPLLLLFALTPESERGELLVGTRRRRPRSTRRPPRPHEPPGQRGLG